MALVGAREVKAVMAKYRAYVETRICDFGPVLIDSPNLDGAIAALGPYVERLVSKELDRTAFGDEWRVVVVDARGTEQTSWLIAR